MSKSPLLLILFFCLKGSLLMGQVPFFQAYYPVKKNQPVEVNVLHQDSRGFIWFGTNKGLFRFDGINFRQYTTRDSLPDNIVTALAEDSLGRLWIGHQNGRLCFMERGIIQPFEPREGNAAKEISDIIFDRRGILWFSTKNDGLYYLMKDRLYRADEAEGLPDIFIYDLHEDSSGRIWAGTDGGIAICSLQDQKIKIEVIATDQGLSDIIIKKIKPLSGDSIAIATEDAGVLIFNYKTKQITPLVKPGWPYGTVSDFTIKENQAWIATPGRGVIVYDGHTGQIKVLDHFHGVSLHSVNTILKDRESNIWLGSKTGLFRTPGNALEHLEILQPGHDNNVLALAVDRRRRTWYSTNEGLFMFTVGEDGSANVTRKFPGTISRNSPVISLYTDIHGYVWAGLYGNGVLRIDPDKDELKHFQSELRNGNILSITGRGEEVWLATLGGGTSIRFQNNRYEIRNYSAVDGLSSDFVYQAVMDSQNRTWFATDGKGVTMLDKRGFHHYDKGLPSKVVYSIAEDVDGSIWVTSQDNGVYRLVGETFVAVPEMRLRDNSIQALVADRHGNVIAIHNFGIDVYDVKRKRMRYWGEETGIHDKQTNLNAVTVDSYGQFFIGTSRGVMKFSLNNDHVSVPPEPVIEGVRIFGEHMDLSRSLQLDYNENNISIQYVGLWYQNTQSLNYLYKLENYDLEWIATGNQEVTYSRLPAGEYTFKVKVSDTDDFSDLKETSISFSISPPFWRTATFYIFIAALFFVGAYALMKFRERKLMEDKMILEAKVEERTKEIQQKTEEIQTQNEEILAQAEEIQGINENLEMLVKQRTAELEKKNRALEEYAFINAHKLRSPVASILGLVNLLAKSDVRDDTRSIREHLQKSADKLDAVVRSITKAIEKADNKYP